jgi:hypothetical protein
VISSLLGANAVATTVTSVTNLPLSQPTAGIDSKDYPGVIITVNATSLTNWEALNAQYSATSAAVAALRSAGAVYATDAEAYVVTWYPTPSPPPPPPVSGMSKQLDSFDVMVYISLAVGMAVVARLLASLRRSRRPVSGARKWEGSRGV